MSSIRIVKTAGTLVLSALALTLAAQTASAGNGAGAQARPAHAAGERAVQRRPQRRPEQRPERPERREHRPDRRVPPDRPYTRETETTRTDDGFTRNTTITNADGETATRNMTVVNDKDAGTRIVDVDRTGFEGRTSGVRHETQRTEDGYTRDSTWDLRNGETRTRSVDVSCDKAAGKCVREVDVNGGVKND